MKDGLSVRVIVAPTPDADAVKLELTKFTDPVLFADPTMVPSSLMVIPFIAPITLLKDISVILLPLPARELAVRVVPSNVKLLLS